MHHSAQQSDYNNIIIIIGAFIFQSVRVFFRTNRGTCLEWLARVRKPVMSVGSACGSPAATVWHGFQTLQEMKKGEKTQVLK